MGAPLTNNDPPIGVARQTESIREKLTRSQRQFAWTRTGALLFAALVMVLLVSDAHRLRERLVPAAISASKALSAVEQAEVAFRSLLLTADPRYQAEWQATWDDEILPLEQSLENALPGRQAMVKHALEQLRTEQQKVLGANSLPLSSEDAAGVLVALDEAMKNVRLALVNTAQSSRIVLLDTVSRSTTVAVAVMTLVILVMLMTFFISARVVRLIHRTVIEPVELLAESASHLATGKLREDVHLDTNDELGRLAKSINQLRVSLALAEMKYRSLFANTSNSMILLDASTLAISDVNHSFEELMGLKRRQLLEKNVLELFEAEQQAQLEEGLQKAQAHGQHTVNGLVLTTPAQLMAVMDVRITSVQVSTEKVIELTFVDVTEQYVKNKALSEIAFKDELTGLFNHRSFYQRLHEEVQRAQEAENTSLILLFVDLDNFKQCNDTFGHQVGDQLLRNVGQLVREHIRQDRDGGFRYGGDEFAVLLPDAKMNVAERIANQVREGFESIEQFGTSMSIGVAAWKAGMDGQALVKAADEALYAAKSAGKNTVRVSA